MLNQNRFFHNIFLSITSLILFFSIDNGIVVRATELTPNFKLHVPILEYHQADYLRGNALGLLPMQFEEEVKWLSAHGYHTIDFQQLYAAFYLGHPLPEKPVLLTFDDGYESVYRKVYPLLKKYKEKATIFMISKYVGLHGTWDMLTENELKTMEESGLVDVESHTATHPNLANASVDETRFQIRESTRELEAITGHAIQFFCYPSGKFNEFTIQQLQANGYLLAVTQGHERACLKQGPYSLHRMVIHQGMPLEDFTQCLTREA